MPGNVRLECFHNGRREMLPLEEALRLFWEVDFAWLLVTDFYRFRVGGRAGQGYMYRAVHRAPRVMVLHLMRRGGRALSLHDLNTLDKRSEFIGSEAFYARMARFNTSLFGDDMPAKFRPFEFTDALEDGSRPVPAYRLNPDRNVLLVVGPMGGDHPGPASPGSDQPPVAGPWGMQGGPKPDGFVRTPGDDVDWGLFESPPAKARRHGRKNERLPAEGAGRKEVSARSTTCKSAHQLPG
jgi:hypothetical protein